MHHVTQVKAAIAALLAERLPEQLLAADGVADDGIETPPPAFVHRSEKRDLEGYPAIELISTHSTPQRNTVAQIVSHRIAVGFTLAGDDEQTLTTWGERYMWALRQVLRGALLPGALGAEPIETGGEQYSPMVQSPKRMESPFVWGGFLEVFVTTVE